MRRLVVIFTLFLVLAGTAAADAAFSGVAPPPPPSPSDLVTLVAMAAEDKFPECNGLPAGQKVCTEDCLKSLLCMGEALNPIVLEDCSADNSYCNKLVGECDKNISSCKESESSNITCNALGMFPDPYDCTTYHICTVGSGYSDYAKCETGWAYDPVTTLCSKKLTDDVCTNLPIKCNNLGESKAFPGDPNIYYICVADSEDPTKYVPELFRCPNGGTYDAGTYSCIGSSS